MSAPATQSTDRVTIFEASHDDVDRLVEYGRTFWEQTTYAAGGISYDVETVTELTHQLVDEGIVLFARNAASTLIGLMLVIIVPCLMNKHVLLACEWVFYVEPDYRRGGLGEVFIDEAEEMLRRKEVKLFTLVSLSNVTPVAANKLYESLGFAHTESNFTKDISWQS